MRGFRSGVRSSSPEYSVRQRMCTTSSTSPPVCTAPPRSPVIPTARRFKMPARESPPRQDFAGLHDQPVSLQSEPADGTGDHQLLNLLGPLENVENLSVAVHPLDRIFTRVTVSAEDLDGPLRRPYRNPAGLQLAHGSLRGGELLTGCAHPRRAPDEQPRCVDLGGDVGEEERDGLFFDNGSPEDNSILRVVECVLVGGPGDSDGHRPDGGPRQLEGGHRRLLGCLAAFARMCELLVEPVFAAEQGTAWDPHA